MNRLTRQVLRLGGSVEKIELWSIVTTRFGPYVFKTFLLGNVGGLETLLERSFVDFEGYYFYYSTCAIFPNFL